MAALAGRIVHFLEQRAFWVTAAVIAAVTLLALVYAVSLGQTLRFLPDEQEYVTLGHNLASGLGYTYDGVLPTAYRPPAYPALLGLATWLGADILGFRILNVLLLALTLALAADLMQRRSGPQAAVLAVLAALAYPVLVFTAGALYPQTLIGFLLILLIWLLQRRPQLDLFSMLAAGAVGGLLTLTAPTFLPISLGMIGWLCWRRRAWQFLLAAILALALVVGGWTLRNWRVFDTFVLISTNGGDNLIRGNSENTTPNSGPSTDVEQYMQQSASLAEPERDRYLQQQVLAFWQADPGRALRLYALKTLNYFNYRNELVTQSESSMLRDLVMLLTYGALLGLLVLRFWWARRYPLSEMELWLVLIYLLNAPYSALVFTRIRYRLPFDWLLILLAAMYLSQWLSGLGKQLSTAVATVYNKGEN